MRITFALSLLILAFFAQEPKTVSVKTIETVQRSIVPVVCARFEPDGSVKIIKIMGSGFLVNRQGGVVTAAHVVQAWEQAAKTEPCVPPIYAPMIRWNDRVDKRGIRAFMLRPGCRANIHTDVVYCVTVDNPFRDAGVKDNIAPIALGDSPVPADGTPVAFTGFPLEYFYPITSKGHVAGYFPVERQLIIDKGAWPGASGSPIYGADGKVIGMLVQSGINHGAGLAYARPISLIRDFLKGNNIPIER
jgi:S1-C subfamily serine protease